MERDMLVTKEDLYMTKQDLSKAITETRQQILDLKAYMESKFNDQLKWLIITMMGFATLIITVIKLT